MGFHDLKDRTCTIQYPYDTYLVLVLTDYLTSPVVLYLITIGSIRTVRLLARAVLPLLARIGRASWRSVYGRFRRDRTPRTTTVADPPRRDRVRPHRPTANPQTTPGSLAILTPARDPPEALVTALNNYQNRAQRDSPRPRVRVPRKDSRS